MNWERNAGTVEDEPARPQELWREAGAYVAMAGSETIISFEANETEQLIAAFEWNEVAVFRKIRGLLRDQPDVTLQSNNRSLYLFMASLLAKTWGGNVDGSRRLLHDSVRFSPFLEAFKLATEIEGGGEYEHVARCASNKYVELFRGLHVTYDSYRTDTNRILDILDGNEHEIHSVWSRSEPGDVVILDAFRDGGVGLIERIETVMSYPSEYRPDIVLIAMGSWQRHVHVFDVFEKTYPLLAMPDLVRVADQAGKIIHYIELAGYDRQSLLPFDGEQSVFLIYLTGAKLADLEKFGFKSLNGDERMGNERALEPLAERNVGANHFSEITGEIPTLDHYVEPDWHSWKAQRDWDPEQCDWTERAYALEIDLLAQTLSWREQPDLKTLVKGLENHGLQNTLSPRQAMVSALEKIEKRPLEAAFFVLLSFEIAGYDPKRIRYLIDCLRYDLKLTDEKLSLLDADSGSSMVELAVSAVFAMLGQKNSAFRAPGLLSRMPAVADSLYKIRGADRSFYLQVRSTLEGLQSGPTIPG